MTRLWEGESYGNNIIRTNMMKLNEVVIRNCKVRFEFSFKIVKMMSFIIYITSQS